MSKGARNRRLRSNGQSDSQTLNLPQKLAPEEREILREIEETAPGVQRLPEAEKLALIRRVSFKIHSGPLPSPEDLQAYAALIPNGAERIMTLTEKQASHRMEVEKQVMIIAPKETRRGQIFAFLIGMGGLLTTVYLASQGMAGAAGVIGTAALGTLAVGFLKTRKG